MRLPALDASPRRPLRITLALGAVLISCAQPGRLVPGSQVPRAAAVAQPPQAEDAAPARHSPPPAPSLAPRGAPPPATISPAGVDFASQVQPILQVRCQPCHFAGGKVYAEMPFDRPETILRLGEKLFTRIKDESQRRAIRRFLSQHAGSTASATSRPAVGASD